MAASLEILPWAVVRGVEALRGGAPVPLQDLLPVLEAALERHGKALLWDMDGIEANRPQLDLLRRLEGLGLWVDAGVRRAEGVIDVLVAGADKAVVGTKSVHDLEELAKAFQLTENILLQVDYDGRVLHPGFAGREPTLPELGAFVRRHGGDAMLFMATRGPPAPETLRPLCAEARVYAGPARREDFAPLLAAGATGAIVDVWEAVSWTT